MARGAGRESKDSRVTIKIDRALAEAIAAQIRDHPQWGITSVSEFIRRSIDRELDYWTNTSGKKVLEIKLTPAHSPDDIRRTGP